jgi:hypothetical protein
MPTMPRKASPIAPNVAQAIADINQYCCDANISVLALSSAAGVAQSALARFLGGERKSITSSASKVLSHIGIRHNRHNRHSDILVNHLNKDEVGCRLINEAIDSLWDGDRRSAEIIAALVLALRPALDVAVDPNRWSEKDAP